MRQRIQVNISDEMVARLDLYSTKMGISRSALCAQFIGQAVMGYDKAFDIIDDLALESKQKLNEEKK